MNRIVFLLLSFLFFGVAQAQIRPVLEKEPDELERNTNIRNDTLSGGNQRNTSNRRIKNLNAKIEDYKIISRENDTTYLDTTLSIYKEYKFNYLRKDEFDLIPFANIGQTYNTLSYDFGNQQLMPKFGARARHFNYMEIDDINYYYVPTPLTELMYKTAFQQGQLLDAFFTVNTSRQYNFSLAYKGLRSLGNYQHALTSTGNLRFTTNYKTKNGNYHARAHIVMQDLMNEENGGLRDEDLLNFESGNPEFIDRSVFDPVFENAKSILIGKRFHLDHYYNILKANDSGKNGHLSIGNIVSFTDKYFEFQQSNQNEFYGEAFENRIHESVSLEDFYVEANATFYHNDLGKLKAQIGYNNFNYGYDKLVQLNGNSITNRLKGSVISAGGSYKNTIGKFHVDGRFGIQVSGDLTGNYFFGRATIDVNDDISAGASINLHSTTPNYNHLLYQSDYVNYNWQNNFNNIETKQLALNFNYKNIARVDFDYNSISDYTYFTKNDEGYVAPYQYGETINYLRLKVGGELKYKNIALNNTIRYQNVIDGEGILNVPEIIVRSTLYYANQIFKKAMYLQTGITLSYFTAYNMNAHDAVLAEFYVQNDTEIGGFPRLDFFINAKVRQTRIYLKAEHFNSSFTGYNFYSAPNNPYRDFTVRFGLVWNFFL